MISNEELTGRIRAQHPVQILDRLAKIAFLAAEGKAENPRIQVFLRLGHSVRGYLIGVTYLDEEPTTRYFVMSLEIERDTDGARDLVYFCGSDVVSVILYDVDDILENLESV
jgi:hypothetical protein